MISYHSVITAEFSGIIWSLRQHTPVNAEFSIVSQLLLQFAQLFSIITETCYYYNIYSNYLVITQLLLKQEQLLTGFFFYYNYLLLQLFQLLLCCYLFIYSPFFLPKP